MISLVDIEGVVPNVVIRSIILKYKPSNEGKHNERLGEGIYQKYKREKKTRETINQRECNRERKIPKIPKGPTTND